eukprot:CAMPEP_0194110356 /NCGR_PEP_ID=MMETSP0150-20130528/9634_1 /TAXON_ID=122233 /ORGANISM="Chaetoceros debilis, Strain MM31A-1" /LENGTH=493 /DNA_ID=CAMNT_0038799525 /DNA_START=63 /DNA_END=1541 /DNA_ORIENTATION=+
MKIASTLFQALLFSFTETSATAGSGLTEILNHAAETFLTAYGTQHRSSISGAFIVSSYANKQLRVNSALCLHTKENSEQISPFYSLVNNNDMDDNVIKKNNPLHVVINGGGPAGLALALALKDCPQIRTTVLEKRPSLDERPINYGQLFIWTKSNCLQVLKQIDCVFARKVEDAVFVPVSVHIEETKYSSLRKISSNDDLVMVNRSFLLKTMEDCLPDMNAVKYETEVVDFVEQADKKVYIRTNRNETLTCDVLVGADGIWSNIKSQMNGPTTDNKMKGIRQLPFEIVGRIYSSDSGKLKNYVKRHSSTLEIHRGKKGFLYNIPGSFLFHFRPLESNCFYIDADTKRTRLEPLSSESEESRNELLANFEGNPKALKVIKSAPDLFRAPLYDYPPSSDKLWSKGRVVLIGDAINAISPVSGNGAMEAMKDAIVLKQELDHITHRDQIVDAFGNYKARRIIKRSAITILGKLMLDATTTQFALMVSVVVGTIMNS